MPSWISVAVVTAIALGLITPGVAHAAPPSNDDFDASAAITTLPFTAQLDRSEATRALDDPLNCNSWAPEGSVWFHHTATEDGFLRVGTAGSDLDVRTSAFTGDRGDLRPVQSGCSGGPNSPMTIRVTAGQTYHFMVTDGYNGRGAATNLSVQRLAPLPNDDFANAQPLTSLPSSTPSPDFSTATFQPDEPSSTACRTTEGARSVWYSYTPSVTQSVVARVRVNGGSGPTLAVYEGASLPELRSLGCTESSYRGGKPFRLVAGTTYHLQLQVWTSTVEPSTLELEAALPLTTDVSSGSSGERSIFNDINFSLYHQNNYDQPVSTEWDFGDGTVLPASTDTSKTHRYSTDGNYTVTVRANTQDGRTTTDTTTVVVKTHDVGIAKFAVPASATAGQQKPISVQVSNTRYLEKNVTVTLYRYGDFGWVEVGQQKLDVPAHPTRKVTFPFAYTFTPEDAVRGKATFRAVVSLPYPTFDALPLDNEAISTATTVRPAATVHAVAN